MIVFRNELPLPIDVDGTLVIHSTKEDPESIKFVHPEDPEQVKWLKPHKPHIAFLKRCFHRGYMISVWSANGFSWAEYVVLKLGLKEYVTYVQTKPFKYVDDLDVDKWMNSRIFMPTDGEK